MADSDLHRPDGGNHLRHGLALRQNLSRRYSDVWQEAEPAGNHEMDQVRIVALYNQSVSDVAQAEIKSESSRVLLCE